MFNYEGQLQHSVNQNVAVPVGQWAEQTVVMFDLDNTTRVNAKLYYHVPSVSAEDVSPLIIDMEIIRNGMPAFYKDFVNFDGAWRDELGRYSTDINDLLPFNNLELHSVGEDYPLFNFEINFKEINHGN